MEPILTAHNLMKTFGSGGTLTVALRDVSMELQPGEIVLLMGPSGSGKSTLLAVMSGLLQPDAGKVVALGQDIWNLTEKQREEFRLKHCGYIFQGYNLFPALNAVQQMEIVLRWGHGVSGREARQRSLEMLELLGLGSRARLRPHELSGGEKQRVAIGRALLKSPTFCFADEPTAALDWKHGEQVVELLTRAAKHENAAVLVVSHDNRIVPHVDRVLHLEDGGFKEDADEEFETTSVSENGMVKVSAAAGLPS